jgi:two-component system, NarL family, nitrate/nitrite response regulator NarL
MIPFRPEPGPVARTARPLRLGVGPHASRVAARHSDTMNLRCLVVDDDRCFLTAVRHMLERAGVATDTAASGSEALERVERSWPDIVLIDLRLGLEDGFEVIERLATRARARPRREGLPTVVLISNYAEEDFAPRIARSSARFLDKSTLCDHLSGEGMRKLVATRKSRAGVRTAGAYGSRGT